MKIRVANVSAYSVDDSTATHQEYLENYTLTMSTNDGLPLDDHMMAVIN